jgi:hypothetical protein
MVLVAVLGAGGMLLLVLCALGLVQAGVRAGDRPADAAVHVRLSESGQPDSARPVLIVTVRNPGTVPLLAGFSVARRQLPGWLDAGMTVHVPRRTIRRRYRAARQEVVGVVPAGTGSSFAVPVPVLARRYLLTAVLGQGGGRLRVFRIPVGGRSVPRPPVRDVSWLGGRRRAV